MKSSTEHLPAHKQKELATIVEAITAEFKNVEMIILFGSYARGEQVEDTYVKDGGIYEYRTRGNKTSASYTLSHVRCTQT
jgi:uncharacterized protein